MSKSPIVHEDPSIRSCAQALICEALDDINRRVRCGDSYWIARTRVLELAAERWVSTYGKQAADMAVRGLHTLDPAEALDPDVKRRQRERNRDKWLSYVARSPERNTRLNRAWIRLFGRALYVVALVALAGLQAVPNAEAATNPSRWRSLALCGVSKPGAERERACRPFSAAERGTWRGYDAPTGTPRSWELPRAWEAERW